MKLKTRIILIFSVIAIGLVALTARVGYVFVRGIYLEQLKEQIHLLCSLAARETDARFLDYVDADVNNMARKFYLRQLNRFRREMQFDDLFLFDSTGTVLVGDSLGLGAAGLDINRALFRSLPVAQSALSLPFKGKDGSWYLWAYYRLTPRYFLGVREQTARLARLDVLALWFYGIAIGGALLIVLAGWWVARSITRPIDRLVDFSATIGSGAFDSAPPEKIHGEFTVLRDALVKMRADLAAKQQEKENMLAEIAHELRNPLGGIELLTGLILEKLSPQDANYEYVQKINAEVQGLKAQITAFLNYSRPAEPEKESVDLRQLARELEQTFLPSFQKKNIRWQTELQQTTVLFDPGHLRRILHNLTENSVQALSEDGHILLKSFSQNGQMVIQLSDTGPGLPEENPERVFEPFYTTRPDGTGLGLAICRKLCRQNGAGISARNNPERGCTFTIRISQS